ncbi:MAG: PhoH family protein [Zhenhengia sp.]|jgi:phosphate starvation-inducible PhoH-like protein|uniref:PhoH family protein n=1 Tax=Zhenhengia sp. TaxID=2944208 RepID=UPI00290EB5C1|nr:PhoH family protein [Clostridiales bacterium]MDU6973524.1 PhoH family protein [Clostridiales bacterium]
MGLDEKKIQIPTYYIAGIFGKFDEHIKLLEKLFHIKVVLRDEDVKISGEPAHIDLAIRTFKELLSAAEKGEVIDTQMVEYTVDLIKKNKEKEFSMATQDLITMTAAGKPLKAKTLGQKQYIDSIRKNMVVFGIGPAGTGKTYLAMAMAVNAFRKNEVSKIILTRPAIEAGEKLGFLPGDLQSKVDPYLRPLYDALFEIMGAEQFEKNMEKGLIEVAPLAYMRGRTLNNAFVVLDEAQNTTPPQMKMFLTRLGFNCKAIITGDLTQIDLQADQKSGLKEAAKILSHVEGIGFSYLNRNDVVRHPLVQKIVDAYDEYEKVHEKPKNNR